MGLYKVAMYLIGITGSLSKLNCTTDKLPVPNYLAYVFVCR